jgi:hypothetical protein
VINIMVDTEETKLQTDAENTADTSTESKSKSSLDNVLASIGDTFDKFKGKGILGAAAGLAVGIGAFKGNPVMTLVSIGGGFAAERAFLGGKDKASEPAVEITPDPVAVANMQAVNAPTAQPNVNKTQTPTAVNTDNRYTQSLSDINSELDAVIAESSKNSSAPEFG